MSLEALPCSIINGIRKVMFHFLWNNHSKTQRYYLCRWEALSKPKKLGGWGFRNLWFFNTALNTNTLWRVLTRDNVWHRVVMDKYLQNTTLDNWLRKPSHFIKSTSRIWSSLVHIIPLILHRISWRPGAGIHIFIGRDKILGLGERSFLQDETIVRFNQFQVYVLSQAVVERNPRMTSEVWRNNSDLGLTGALADDWKTLLKN